MEGTIIIICNDIDLWLWWWGGEQSDVDYMEGTIITIGIAHYDVDEEENEVMLIIWKVAVGCSHSGGL